MQEPLVLTPQQKAYVADPHHPLSQAWLHDTSDKAQRSGRSTAMLLSFLQTAWERPGTWILVGDHFPTLESNRYLIDCLMGLCERSGVGRYMEFVQRGRDHYFCVSPEKLGLTFDQCHALLDG